MTPVGHAPTTQRRKRRMPVVHKWIRRIHMYFGIALLPWVLLYGVTAVLFNHSSWMNDIEIENVSADQLRATALSRIPSADYLAERFVSALNLPACEASPPIELVNGSARWSGRFSLDGRERDQRVRLSVEPELRGGTARLWESSPAVDDPPWASDFDDELMSDMRAIESSELQAAGRALALGFGLEVEDMAIRRWPQVRFDVTDGAERYSCRVGLDGEIDVQRHGAPTSLRRRLLRLHLQHRYAGYAGSASAWAVVVDAMGFAMIFWAISGVLMWWTIRKTRRSGLIALVVGCVAMIGLALSVWRASGLA